MKVDITLHPQMAFVVDHVMDRRSDLIALPPEPEQALVDMRVRIDKPWKDDPATAIELVIRTREPELLPLAAAVAVAETCGDEAQIKWPNDIWLGRGHKVAGILVETRQSGSDPWFVVGIGINASASRGARSGTGQSSASSKAAAHSALRNGWPWAICRIAAASVANSSLLETIPLAPALKHREMTLRRPSWV